MVQTQISKPGCTLALAQLASRASPYCWCFSSPVSKANRKPDPQTEVLLVNTLAAVFEGDVFCALFSTAYMGSRS